MQPLVKKCQILYIPITTKIINDKFIAFSRFTPDLEILKGMQKDRTEDINIKNFGENFTSVCTDHISTVSDV